MSGKTLNLERNVERGRKCRIRKIKLKRQRFLPSANPHLKSKGFKKFPIKRATLLITCFPEQYGAKFCTVRILMLALFTWILHEQRRSPESCRVLPPHKFSKLL